MNKNDRIKAAPERPSLEVADIVKRFGQQYLTNHPVSYGGIKILRDIEYCRTMEMGGHKRECDTCFHEEIAYNSCRNRHCPKCGALNKARWLEARTAELLPIRYFHGVFTISHLLNGLFLYNKQVLLNDLFKAVRDTLNTFTQDPKYALTGQCGCTMVLHTWDQKLNPHFHLHCIIPAGVFSKTDHQWIQAKYRFLFPVKAMSKVFRGKLVSFIRRRFKNGELNFSGTIANLASKAAFSALLSEVMGKSWNVYCKTPFKSPKFVLDYLGRYTHRVAISNHRIQNITDQAVTFTYKNRKNNHSTEQCILKGAQFIKRFLSHELPSGFMRIRHYGFLGSAGKAKNLAEIRRLIGAEPQPVIVKKSTTIELLKSLTGIDISVCPKCQAGKMKIAATFEKLKQIYRYNINLAQT